jgi:hypothetical protein
MTEENIDLQIMNHVDVAFSLLADAKNKMDERSQYIQEAAMDFFRYAPKMELDPSWMLPTITYTIAKLQLLPFPLLVQRYVNEYAVSNIEASAWNIEQFEIKLER